MKQEKLKNNEDFERLGIDPENENVETGNLGNTHDGRFFIRFLSTPHIVIMNSSMHTLFFCLFQPSSNQKPSLAVTPVLAGHARVLAIGTRTAYITAVYQQGARYLLLFRHCPMDEHVYYQFDDTDLGQFEEEVHSLDYEGIFPPARIVVGTDSPSPGSALSVESFMQGIHENGDAVWKRVKLIILGDAAAGKSSVLRWLTDQPFVEKHIVTDGADVECVDIQDWKKCDEVKPFEILMDNITLNMKVKGNDNSCASGEQEISHNNNNTNSNNSTNNSTSASIPKKIQLTHEMEDTITHLSSEHLTNSNHTIFHVWDFAGQEVYYATHSYFLSELAIYMLVVDVSKPMDEKWLSRVRFWLYSIRTRASKAPIMVVGTHLDSVYNPDIVILDMQQRIKNLIIEAPQMHGDISLKLEVENSNGSPFFCVSCKQENDKKTDIRNYLKALAETLVSKTGKCPATWLLLMDRVFTKKYETAPSIMNWESAVKLAEECAVTEAELTNCLRFCHNLGFVLYYHSDPTLSSVIFVHPKEVIAALRTVITAESISKKVQGKVDILAVDFLKQGKLAPSLLAVMWAKYEPSTHDLLKQLFVSKFRLACADSAGCLIVPYLFLHNETENTLKPTINYSLFTCTYQLGLYTPFGFTAQLFVTLYEQAQLLPNKQSSYSLLRNTEKDASCRLQCEKCWVVVSVGTGMVELTVESRPKNGSFMQAVISILYCIRGAAQDHKAPRDTISWKCPKKGCDVDRAQIPEELAELLCDYCCVEAGDEYDQEEDLHAVWTTKTIGRVLFAESNPPGTMLTLSGTALRELQEIVPIKHAPAVTWKSLQRNLQQFKPAVLQLWAHGDRDGDIYRIVLSDNDQLPIEVQRKMDNYTISAKQLAELITSTPSVEYVLLSVCFSATFVEEIYKQNPNCKCVGFNDLVSPSYMTRWCIGFYHGLKRQYSFHDCVKQGFLYLDLNPVRLTADAEQFEYNRFKTAMVVKPAV